MAKKWPPALSTNALSGRDLDPAFISSGSIASNPPAPSAPALWFMVADPTAAEFRVSGGVHWHASFEANRAVRSNYWQKSQ
jgi:hypothetical protein